MLTWCVLPWSILPWTAATLCRQIRLWQEKDFDFVHDHALQAMTFTRPTHFDTGNARDIGMLMDVVADLVVLAKASCQVPLAKLYALRGCDKAH